MAYAKGTGVGVDKTRNEIERTLTKYGATSFAYGWSANGASIMFEAKDRRVRFLLPLPGRKDERFNFFRRGRSNYLSPRPPEVAQKAWEQACRERWRSLLLAVKARLESVDAGIESFEDAFFAHIVMPDGKTVGEHARPQIAAAYKSGQVRPLLTSGVN